MTQDELKAILEANGASIDYIICHDGPCTAIMFQTGVEIHEACFAAYEYNEPIDEDELVEALRVKSHELFKLIGKPIPEELKDA